jgi:uracil-DNA glycosylase family 4
MHAPQENLTRCTNCAFQWGKLVGSRGPKDSPLVIVGEGPGKNEILENLPFVGPSGEVLSAALKQHPDISPYITNATICFPGTVKHKDQERIRNATVACHGRLTNELLEHPRQVILALGNAALWSCTDNYSLKITQVRGKVFPSQLAARGIVAAVHPSFLLRGGGSLRQFMADVDYACSLTKGNDFRQFTIPEYQVIENTDQLRQLANQFRQLPDGTPIASDTETGGFQGFDHIRDHVICQGFCYSPELVYVLPEPLIRESAPLYQNKCRIVWHNGKFDAKFIRRAGIPNVRVDEDTMLLSYALDEIGGVHDLETVASDILGAPDWKYIIKPFLEISKNIHPKGYTTTYADIPPPILYDYMARDISSTLQIFSHLRNQVSINPHLERLYTRTLMPYSTYFMKIEEAGMALDLDQVNANGERLQEKIDEYEREINTYANNCGAGSINPRSPIQLTSFLYDGLGLRINGKRPGSTDEGTLDKLPQVPAVVALKRFRKVQKAKSTYVDPAPEWINIDGRVHTTYLIHGTRTGRPASKSPNLLNIPRDPMLRGQFRAAPGHVFLEVDENQAELRVLADLSGDPELLRIYLTPNSPGIHDVVTLDLFGSIDTYGPETYERMLQKFNLSHIASDQKEHLYHEQKMKAKNVNFGIVYGITNVGLADQIDDTPQVAQVYLDKWYQRFPVARTCLLKFREAVVLGQKLITPFGRIKRFGAVSQALVNELQNQASNFPMQSIAFDIMGHTGIVMQPIAEKLGVPIVNAVYDSIVYECPNDPNLLNDLAAQTIATVAERAKYWGMKTVPMKAEAKVGERWGNLKDFHVT